MFYIVSLEEMLNFPRIRLLIFVTYGVSLPSSVRYYIQLLISLHH